MLLTTEVIEEFKCLVKKGSISVVVFDTETSPAKFWAWGTGEQYVRADQLVEGTETRIITAQYKYSLDKKVNFLEWKKHKNKEGGDDTEVVKKLVPILNSADIVIGQNSKSFDIKVLQERAKVLRLPPVQVDFMLDTMTSSRGSFRSLSHSLDYRSKQYGLGGKHKMDMKDWIDIVEGRTKPSKKMIPYGLKDAEDTDNMFWLDLPYYNLPQATINKILKLVRKFNVVEKPHCLRCKKYKHKQYNIKSLGKGKFKCLNCSKEFK